MKMGNNLKIYLRGISKEGLNIGLPILSGGLFGAYLSGKLNLILLLLMFLAGFSFSIVAAIAKETKRNLKKIESEDYDTEYFKSKPITLKELILIVIVFQFISGISGMGIVFITGNFNIFIAGLLSAFAAIGYSWGPKPYSIYPVSELVAGFFTGIMGCLISAYLQTNKMSGEIILYSVIAIILTVFWNSTNNTADYKKDLGYKVTLPHVIGFRNSIRIIIPEGIVVIICWTILYITSNITSFMFISGLFVFYHWGYKLWYKDYYKIKELYPDMNKDWCYKPLKLMFNFHIVSSIEFLLMIYIDKIIIF